MTNRHNYAKRCRIVPVTLNTCAAVHAATGDRVECTRDNQAQARRAVLRLARKLGWWVGNERSTP